MTVMMQVNLLTQFYKPIFQLMALFIDFHIQGHHNKMACQNADIDILKKLD